MSTTESTIGAAGPAIVSILSLIVSVTTDFTVSDIGSIISETTEVSTIFGSDLTSLNKSLRSILFNEESILSTKVLISELFVDILIFLGLKFSTLSSVISVCCSILLIGSLNNIFLTSSGLAKLVSFSSIESISSLDFAGSSVVKKGYFGPNLLVAQQDFQDACQQVS